MTLTGKLFRSYAEELIKKDRFGTNKMIGYPKFWNEYVDELKEKKELREEAMNNYIEEKVAEEIKNAKEHDWWTPFNGKTETEYRAYIRKEYTWVPGCELIDRAYKELNNCLDWLIENGYMRTWKKRAFSATSYYQYYGLTAKGWSVANKYLNAKS